MQQAEAQTLVAQRLEQQRPRAGRGRFWGRVLLAALCWLQLLLAVVLWGILHGASDRWWPATALMFGPRWVWVVPVVLLVPAAVLWRRRLLWPLGAALVVLVGPVMGLCLPLPDLSAGAPASAVFRVLTCNTHRQELDAPALGRLIAETQPDVVALQEWMGRHKSAVFAGEGWHIGRVDELCLASRHPIRQVKTLDHPSFAGGTWGAVARYELDTPAGLVHVVNVHLASPRKGLEQVLTSWGRHSAQLQANSDRRRTQSLETVRWLDACQGPLLLAGDFNTPPDSTIYRACWSGYTNAFSATGLGFGLTFQTKRGSIRIDHILAGPGWACRRCWVGPDVGSAHRPVVADFAWESSPKPQN